MIEYRVRRIKACWPHDEIWFDDAIQDVDTLIDYVTGLNNRSVALTKFKFKEKIYFKGLKVDDKLCIVKAEV